MFIDGLKTFISLDRLLALILGMRYRQIVTLKRTSFVVVTIWVTATAAASLYFLNTCITVWYGRIGIPMCLTLPFASYTKISYTLRRSTRSCSTRTTGAGGITCVLSSTTHSNNFLNLEWIIIVTVACMEYNWSFSLLKFVVKFWKSMRQMTYEQCSQTVILAHVLTDKRAYAIL